MILGTKSRPKSTKTVENLVLSLLSTKQSTSLKKGPKSSTSTMLTPSWSSRMCSWASTKLPGSRLCKSTSRSQLTWTAKQDCSSATNFLHAWSFLLSTFCTRRSHKTSSTSIWCPVAITTSKWTSRWVPLIILIDGKRWCALRVCYPKAISKCSMRNNRWNGFIWPSTSLIAQSTCNPGTS